MNGRTEKVRMSSSIRKNLKQIFEMPEDKFSALVELLKDIPLIRSRGDLLRELPDNNGHFSKSELLEIVELLVDLDSSAREFESDFDKYIDNLLISISAEMSVVQVVKERLLLLKERTKCVSLVSKARDLWSELPKRLDNCRILSDIRPIFADALGDVPADGLTVHTLVLNFTESGVEKSFHVNLDESGLNMLQDVIDRARIKQNLNEQLMNQAGVKMVKLLSYTQ